MTTWTDDDRALMMVVDRAIAGNPRSAQVAVGPSGLGEPCPRALLHMLAGVRAERRELSGWRPAVGTATHAYLADAMEAENARLGRRRWLTERRVDVGEYAGVRVTGSADLFDVDAHVVYDWKTCSATKLKSYRANGPGDRYRTQAHLYGRGYARLGLAPVEVGIVFLPRDGELGSAHVWRETWDEQVAVDALSRAAALKALLDAFGLERATGTFEPCGGSYCDACPRAAASIFG